ncbi:unnamed protein product [Tilletia caries]|uniref:Uncharacterized protein n=1 Tax=Tilletia caries TaxID=13290 RepID=A0ABN7J3J7_9BASI|nr:unnamed protein product [Tilletia caries]CAD6952827.1 unnamed protein product [Tilletia caries]CAD7065965.1 unnamed protein product [Tilletia caries]
MCPFPHHNSVLVLVSASIYHAQEIRSLVEDNLPHRAGILQDQVELPSATGRAREGRRLLRGDAYNHPSRLHF